MSFINHNVCIMYLVPVYCLVFSVKTPVDFNAFSTVTSRMYCAVVNSDNVLHVTVSRQLIVHVLHSNGLSCLHKRIAITAGTLILLTQCMCLQLSYL